MGSTGRNGEKKREKERERKRECCRRRPTSLAIVILRPLLEYFDLFAIHCCTTEHSSLLVLIRRERIIFTVRPVS